MKSVEQLAQAAYEAFRKKIVIPVAGYQPSTWKELDQPRREAWIAAVQAVRAEIEAVH